MMSGASSPIAVCACFNFRPHFGQAVADAETGFPQSGHGDNLVEIGVVLFLAAVGTVGSLSGIGWPHDEHFSATFIFFLIQAHAM
jgi:hypothetical protein